MVRIFRLFMDYGAMIGLETHVQLKTKSKLWCGCANAFGAPPNTNVCPVWLVGLHGRRSAGDGKKGAIPASFGSFRDSNQ